VQPPCPVRENSVDPWRERGALDRALAVALDEREDDVLAAQARQQLAARSVAEAVVADLLAKVAGLDVGPQLSGHDPPAALVEAMGVWDTNCAPNTQQSSQQRRAP
jgi:hypothetical protein